MSTIRTRLRRNDEPHHVAPQKPDGRLPTETRRLASIAGLRIPAIYSTSAFVFCACYPVFATWQGCSSGLPRPQTGRSGSVGIGRVNLDNAPRHRAARQQVKKNPARAGPIRTSKPQERFMFARFGGRRVTDALRPLPCQKCHLTGVLAWLINATGKCDEGPASVSLHVRFRPTHAPAPVAQHPVWPGPFPLARAPRLSRSITHHTIPRFQYRRSARTASS
jgi:hypothetical protein